MSHLWNLFNLVSVEDQLSERHRPSGLNGSFHSQARSMQEYVDECRRKVIQARTDLDSDKREWIIDGNTPFILRGHQGEGPRRGILLVHGLTDAPFLVRDIAEFFREQGFCALAMQLPGHGTRPGDLLDFRWQDWVHAHDHVLALLRAEVDEIWLLGFSAGAVLNLYQTLLHPRDDIKGLFLFSPAIHVRRLAQLTCPLAHFGKRWSRFTWFDVQPDTDFFKYESIPNHAICEVFKLVEAFRHLHRLTELKVPIFLAASETDVTVDSGAAMAWFGDLAGMPKRMLYYSSGSPRVPDKVKILPASFPELNIKTFAHTALLQSPDNPHYGAAGEHRVCQHYYRLDRAKYQRCKAGREDCLGEMFHESADCQVVRRLTYNPMFQDMLGEIERFLQETAGAQC